MDIRHTLDIRHILYINLEHRIDRKLHVEAQLDSIGLVNYTRFNAIQMDNGMLGCSYSHLKCLHYAKENNWNHVLIVEDDIVFLQPKLFVEKLNTFLKKHQDDWDVILLAGNNFDPYDNIDDSCIKVSNCQTTTGYIVKNHYYDKLINNFETSINKLAIESGNHHYAIDQYWKVLQKTDNWYLIIPLSVIQLSDYSDIEKKNTNYRDKMLQLTKRPIKKNHKTLVMY